MPDKTVENAMLEQIWHCNSRPRPYTPGMYMKANYPAVQWHRSAAVELARRPKP